MSGNRSAVGGYDEALCGIYGTDGPFRKKLRAQATIVHLEDVAIVRYSREVIPDASTRVDRNAFRAVEHARVGSAPALSIPWQRQLSAVAA